MARIDAAYQYLLTTYGKSIGSRYDSHKKSELRDVYNSIIKTNKESPLYKIVQSGDVTRFAIDIKHSAHNIQTVLASLSETSDDISSVLNKKIAVSSDEDSVAVTYVGDPLNDDSKTFDMDVIQLAKPQVNQGHFLRSKDRSFEEGSFTFDLDTTSNSYEFQFNVNPGDTNLDVQSRIARLVNQSDIGLEAQIITNDKDESALQITSKHTGLAPEEDYLFRIQSGSSWNEIHKLGIDAITSPAENSRFLLNGKEHSSLANTFTINRAFEITLKAPSSQEKSVHIGFKANADAIGDSVDEMLQAYNQMVDVAREYLPLQKTHQLFNDIRNIAGHMESDLYAAGIEIDETDHLVLNREQLSNVVSSEDAPKHFSTLNRFKQALARHAQKASIHPMHYVDKVIVEYKNPGKTLAAPYAPSLYSGMLVDQFL